MKITDLLKENINGVEGSFLLKDEKIIECDLEKEKIYFLSKNIHFLLESFSDSGKDLKKICIDADKHCRIYFYEDYILGIAASANVNLPLLEIMSPKLLFTIEKPAEKKEEVVDEALQRMNAFIG
ncbi:MAG: hypothetical protein PVF58_11465 [Candidatus Methanofastidiosia archaeon]|jgi:hypothetical protein